MMASSPAEVFLLLELRTREDGDWRMSTGGSSPGVPGLLCNTGYPCQGPFLKFEEATK